MRSETTLDEAGLFTPTDVAIPSSTGWASGSEPETPGIGAASARGGNLPILPQMTPRRRMSLAVKRTMDIAIALMALVLLAPLLVIIAMAVKASTPGPALFRQEREGLDGKRFHIFKFRTMSVSTGDPTGVAQTVRDDPRITPLGALLRRTSADELPQLFNVLGGEMSLVGPRPHVPDMRAAGMRYDELVPHYALRHAMKPGLTGWAQANGYRGPTSDASNAIARIEHDLHYIEHFSLGLDIKIMAVTLKKELTAGTGF